jgi:OOP family OmpA-OmpF porin
MKKSLLALAVVSALATTSAYAGTDGFYVGAKAGYNLWSASTEHDQWDPKDQRVTNELDRNAFTAGIFLGYNFNDYLGLEFAYDYLGKMGINHLTLRNGTVASGDLWTNGFELAGRFMLPFTEDFEAYAKAGVFAFNTNSNIAKHHNGVVPLFGAGLQYYFTDNLFARFEYDWFHKLAKTTVNGVNPDANTFTLGVGYSFGSRAVPVVAEAPAPKTVTKQLNEVRTLDSDVAFDFDKYTLTKAGKVELDNISDDINNSDIQNRRITVIGHTDRIGSAAYNQKLSEKRAKTVVDYLGNKGVVVDAYEGRGKTQPLTGDECNGLSRSKLIKCLAKDRRVEVNIQGEIVKTVEVQE